jgi:hypothetical protein
MNKNIALLAISRSVSCQLKNSHKDHAITELDNNIILRIILQSISHCVALRGLRFITFGFIGSTHRAMAGNQSVITLSHNKWIANKGIGTHSRLATKRTAISHIFDTII